MGLRFECQEEEKKKTKRGKAHFIYFILQIRARRGKDFDWHFILIPHSLETYSIHSNSAIFIFRDIQNPWHLNRGIITTKDRALEDCELKCDAFGILYLYI